MADAPAKQGKWVIIPQEGQARENLAAVFEYAGFPAISPVHPETGIFSVDGDVEHVQLLAENNGAVVWANEKAPD